MTNLSRGVFVAGTLAATTSPYVGRAASSYVRYNIYNVMERCNLQSILTGYEQAVSKMLALDSNDPRSWIYQASLHGTTASQILPGWNSCEHGSYFFFSWHRMYLYWFERIVRSFSGVNTFALPYWNYSNGLIPGNIENVLPAPFTNPATSLYTAQRNAGINAGQGLPASAIAIAASLSDTSFSAGGVSSFGFGSGVPSPDVPFQFLFYTGDLEQQPHNIVHDTIGGLMGDITTAAQDPIFYLHHANIDRLWAVWIASGGGRKNPTDNTWKTYPFTFYDEHGNQQVMTGQQITSTLSLGYQYSAQEPPQRKCRITAGRQRAQSLDSVLSREASPKMRMGGPLSAHGVQLVAPRVLVSVTSTFKPETSQALEKTEPLNNVVFLRFDGITYDRAPGYYYEIYLNLPDGVTPNYLNKWYVGNLSFFGAWLHVKGKMSNKPEIFDITPLVQRQVRAGSWGAANKVTLVMQGAKDPSRLQFAVQANTRVDGVLIVEK